MPVAVKTIANWKAFTEAVDPLAVARDSEWPLLNHVFRGQEPPSKDASANWGLRPTILRCLPRSIDRVGALRVEMQAVENFREVAHHYFPLQELLHLPPDGADAAWLTLMQHHGAATRLLDWTFSPYVAAYFAVRDLHPACDGEIWHFNRQHLIGAFGRVHGNCPQEDMMKCAVDKVDKWIEPHGEPVRIAVLMMLHVKPIRVHVQQGAFTSCNDILADHAQAIEELQSLSNWSEPSILEKWVIQADAKVEFLRNLQAMNVTGLSLFPSPDGLGRHVTDMVRYGARVVR